MQLNGRYRIVQQLGEGTSGGVFLVRDAFHKDLPVALKILHKNSLDAAMLETLQTEFLTLQQFDHPNLVHVFDFGKIVSGDLEEYRGDFFLTMDYLEGPTLLDATEGVTWEFYYEVIFQLAMTLDYLHHHGLIHFDIKPQNIMVTNAAMDGQAIPLVKIIDFGFALSRTEGIRPGVRGSLRYLAPELLSGAPHDHRVDLYSLGATMFEAICRRPPFVAEDSLGLVKAHLSQSVPKISEFRPDAPADLVDLVSSLLEKDPNRRLPSAWVIVQRVREKAERFQHFYEGPYGAPSRVMVGRKEDLASLLNFLRHAIGAKEETQSPNEKKTLCLVGEAGIGKTRLLEEVRRRAAIEEIPFFASRCFSTASRPFEPFRTLLRAAVFTLRMFGQRGEDVLSRFNQLVATLLPDVLSEPTQSKPLSVHTKESRLLFMDSFARLLGDASAIRPFAIWIDDVELADEASVELIRFLLRTLGRSPVAFFLTVESAEGVSSVLEKPSHATMFPLRQLNEGEIAELTHLLLRMVSIPENVVQYLADEVGGSPYLLREYLGQLGESGTADALQALVTSTAVEKGEAAFPKGIADVYARRRARQRPEEQNVLDLLSCLRAPIELSLLEEIVGSSHAGLIDILDRLTKSGMVTSLESGTMYYFAHAQFRNYIYQNIGRSREQLHRAIAEGMITTIAQKTDSYLERIAYHFQKAGEREKAYEYYLRAADYARSLSSHKEQVRLLEEALRLRKSKEEQGAMIEQLAEGYAHIASYSKACSLYEQLLEQSELPPSRRYAYLRSLGRILAQQGLFEEALQNLFKASRLVTSVGDRIEIEGDVVAIDISRGQYKEARHRCMRVLESIEDRRSHPGISDLLNKLGVICFYENKHEDAAQYFHQAIQMFEFTGAKEKLVHAYMNLGNIYSAREHFSNAERHWQTALELSKEVGNLEQEAQIYNNLGIACYAQEKYPEALEYYSHSRGIFTRLGNLPGEAYCLTNMGEVHFAEAEYEKALRRWQQSLFLYESIQDEQGLVEAHNQLSQVYLVLGILSDAERHLREARTIIEKGVIESQRGTYYLLRGILEELHGQREEAYRFTSKAEQFFEKTGDEKNHCASLLRLGHLHRIDNRSSEAADLFLPALGMSAEKKYGHLKSEILYELGILAEGSSFPGKQAPLTYYKEAFDELQQQSIGETTWKLCLALAREYRKRGLVGKANECALQGKRALEYLVSLFTDDSLRKHYLLSDQRAEAAKEFQQLSAMIQ